MSINALFMNSSKSSYQQAKMVLGKVTEDVM